MVNPNNKSPFLDGRIHFQENWDGLRFWVYHMSSNLPSQKLTQKSSVVNCLKKSQTKKNTRNHEIWPEIPNFFHSNPQPAASAERVPAAQTRARRGALAFMDFRNRWGKRHGQP